LNHESQWINCELPGVSGKKGVVLSVIVSLQDICKRKEKPKVSVCIQLSSTVQGHQGKVALHLQGPVHSLKLLKLDFLYLIMLPYRRPIVVVWSNESSTAKFRGPLRIAIAPFVLVSI